MSFNYLVTGGAGFIGSNYVHRLLARGEKATIYDNLSRTRRNIEWLRETFGADSFRLVEADVRDADQLRGRHKTRMSSSTLRGRWRLLLR